MHIGEGFSASDFDQILQIWKNFSSLTYTSNLLMETFVSDQKDFPSNLRYVSDFEARGILIVYL